jgi:hypothetical protein
MKTILTTIWLICFSTEMIEGRAIAKEGVGTDRVGIEIVEPPPVHCPMKYGICLTAGALATVDAAAATESVSLHPVAASPPRFTRLAALAPHGSGDHVDDSVPWIVLMNASLRHPALAGNAIFLIYDSDNPKALSEHEVTAAWQVRVPAGDRISARLTLSPLGGFRPGHSYHIRVAQIIRGREVVLADGSIRLL